MAKDRILACQQPLDLLAHAIFAQTLAECSIERAFGQKMRVETAEDRTVRLVLGDGVVDLARVAQLRVIAIGKAAGTLLAALLPRIPLPASCDVQGVLIAPKPPAQLPRGFQFFAGGHPLPNEASFAGARAILSMLNEVPKVKSGVAESLCLFLVSGGASAMMELPLDPTITLEDTIAFHRTLVHSGASIAEMNCVRKHFSAVKGGRLAAAAQGAECFSLFVSDVPSGHLDTIASGPTVPDTSTLAECREILQRYKLLERFPASVRQFFTSADLPETPKPQDLVTHSLMLLDASDLADAARKHAEQLGFHVVIDNTCDDWDYRAASEYLLTRLRALRREHPRVCLISVGEVAVSADNDSLIASGIGGRNQHFALYTATQLQPSDAPITVLSAGSDGIDGNSTAAGAVIDEHTLRSPRTGAEGRSVEQLQSDGHAALEQFCSFPFLQSRGAIITTGPTGNNLRDLRLLLAE
jgi:hydroxypyruvate reductase